MIDIRNLGKTFRLSRKRLKEEGAGREGRTIDAVADINLQCRPGRVLTLLGPNGAGKTTMLRMIATLMKPTSGSIEVEGFDTVRSPQEVRARIGFLTGSTNLYARLTPNEVIRYYADLHGMKGSRFTRRKEDLFELLDMNSFADRRIGKLSSGMKQKVSIVRTIIHDPSVVIFDEPTSGLDVITSASIMELIRRCTSEGRTVVFSTHIMSEVSLLSDDLAILHRGRLLYSDSMESFRSSMIESSLEEEFIRILGEAG